MNLIKIDYIYINFHYYILLFLKIEKVFKNNLYKNYNTIKCHAFLD